VIHVRRPFLGVIVSSSICVCISELVTYVRNLFFT